MRAVAVAAAAALVGAALYYVWSSSQTSAATAGDEESNTFLDTVDTMTSKINGGWPAGSDPYQEKIQTAEVVNGLPQMLLAWLLWKESRYNPNIISGKVRSSVGALGIAQFMPATAVDELGSVNAALDPDRAIPGAARYLRKLYGATGTWEGALAAYNWGVGNVKRKGLASAPAETVNYYTDIMARAGLEYAA